MTSRVAVLVDGDNIPADHSDEILSLAGRFGRIDIARVYADARNTPKWAEDARVRLVHAGCGKNASDILLVIDAVEMALIQGIEVIVVASSDGDFTHLVRKLRELGRTAVGMGTAKAPDRFRLGCTQFHELSQQQRSLPAPLPLVSDLDRNIRAMIALHSQKGRGMALANLAPRMHVQHRVRISSFAEGSWRGYLEARPELYDLDPRGPEAMVRFLPQGFRAAGA